MKTGSNAARPTAFGCPADWADDGRSPTRPYAAAMDMGDQLLSDRAAMAPSRRRKGAVVWMLIAALVVAVGGALATAVLWSDGSPTAADQDARDIALTTNWEPSDAPVWRIQAPSAPWQASSTAGDVIEYVRGDGSTLRAYQLGVVRAVSAADDQVTTQSALDEQFTDALRYPSVEKQPATTIVVSASDGSTIEFSVLDYTYVDDAGQAVHARFAARGTIGGALALGYVAPQESFNETDWSEFANQAVLEVP